MFNTHALQSDAAICGFSKLEFMLCLAVLGNCQRVHEPEYCHMIGATFDKTKTCDKTKKRDPSGGATSATSQIKLHFLVCKV